MKRFLSTLIILFSLSAHGKFLVISDVDDTLKESFVLNKFQMVLRAFRTDVDIAFPGMTNVLNAVVDEQKRRGQEIRVYYVSSAPAFLMREKHAQFLANSQFPAGFLELRSLKDPKEYKLVTIREILKKERPQAVLMLGDHGEKDTMVYAQIDEELKKQRIPNATFIRRLYPLTLTTEEGMAPQPPQAGQHPFVSAAELALGLYDLGLLRAPIIREQLAKYHLPGAEYVQCSGHRLVSGRSAFDLPDVVRFVGKSIENSCR